jgi:hypothetical protein
VIKRTFNTVALLISALLLLAATSCGSHGFQQLDAQQSERGASALLGVPGLLPGAVTTLLPEARIQLNVSGSSAWVASPWALDSVVLFTADGRYFTFSSLRVSGVFSTPDGTPVVNVLAKSGRGSKWFLDNSRWQQDPSGIWYPDSCALPGLLTANQTSAAPAPAVTP